MGSGPVCKLRIRGVALSAQAERFPQPIAMQEHRASILLVVARSHCSGRSCVKTVKNNARPLSKGLEITPSMVRGTLPR